MTSSNGNIFRVTGPLCGDFTGPGKFPTQRPVTRSFDVFFDLRLNKRLSKQPWGWWFETPSWSSWRQCNVEIHSLRGSVVGEIYQSYVAICTGFVYMRGHLVSQAGWLLFIKHKLFSNYTCCYIISVLNMTFICTYYPCGLISTVAISVLIWSVPPQNGICHSFHRLYMY